MRNKTKHVLKRALAVIMSMAVIFAAIPCYPAHAETIAEETTPSVSITSESVTAGNSTTLYVKASDFESVAGLEMAVHYDANAFDVSYAWTTGLADGQVNDLNYATDGTVKYSMISVDGVSGSDYLLGINFDTTSETKAGDYPITVTVSDAYDVNFNSLSVGKSSGNITVKERPQTVEDIYFYSQVDKSSVETGEAFTYSLMTGYMSDLSGGNFEFTYDSDALEVVDVSLADALTSKTAVQSINTKTPGYIKVSYAAIEAIGANYWDKLIEITFKAKDKAYDATGIVFSTTELVGEDLAAMSSSKLTDYIEITKPEAVIDNPDFILSWDGTMAADRTVDIIAKLPADTSVAAGDFVITYDTDQLKCISAKADSAITGNGGYLVTKEDIGNGKVKFSYVTTKPSDKETALLNMTFEAVDQFIGEADLSVTGTGVVDIDFKDIVIDYPDKTINIGKLDISDKAVSGIDDSYVYTGAAIKPEIAIEGLRANIDYTVTYKNNTNVGKAEVIINGKGNYSGEITKTFQITHADITGVTAESYKAAYDGKAHGITLNGVPDGATVTYAEKEDGEYTASPIRLQNVGTKAVYYKVSKANYNDVYGSAKITITAASIEKLQVEGIETEYTYTGNNIEPKVTIEGLALGSDYEVTYDDNLNVGTAKVAITGKDNYFGTIEKTFVIKPASIEDMDVEDLKASYVYTGVELEPEVTLDGLISGTDYDVIYSDNTNVGTAKVVLTGKGNYIGIKTVSFEITPATMTGISAEGYEGVYDGKDHSIVVEGVPEDATIMYATSRYGEYTAEKPSRMNTGKITVYYKVSKDNYNDFIGSAEVVILPATMTEVDVAGYEGVYDGNAHTLSVNGLPEGAEIVFSSGNNESYTSEPTAITNAGNLTIYYKVTKADYSAVEGFVEIIIKPASITNLTVSGVKDKYDCTGGAIEPGAVIDGLEKGRDYTVSYSNNNTAGIARIVFEGLGNYTGSKTVIFEIVHKYSDALTSDEDSHWYQCICGARDEEKGHVFGEWQVNANKHWRVCECGVISDETGHSFNWIVDKTATEDETGLKHEECDTCKYKRNVGTVIDRLPHTHDMAFVDAIEPTHTEDGNIAYYMCNKCEECFADKDGQLVLSKDDVIIKALGHSYPDGEWNSDVDAHWQLCSCGAASEKKAHEFKWVIDKAATEKETGLKHEECITCGYCRNENTVIDKLEHVHNMAYVSPNSATCTSDGNIEYYYCYNCQKNFYDADGQLEILGNEYILPRGHEPTYVQGEEATCNTDGVREHYHCPKCELYFYDEACTMEMDKWDVIISSTGDHKYEMMFNEQLHWLRCSACGEEVDYEDHIMEWIVDEPATESTTGVKHEECITCGYCRNENTVIDKIEHVHSMTPVMYQEPTCTTNGNIDCHYCMNCGKYYYDYEGMLEIAWEDFIIPAGHTVEYVQGVDPTCNSDGIREHYFCAKCETYFYDEACSMEMNKMDVFLNSTGDHSLKWVIDIPATEDSTGLKHETCTICGYTQNWNTVIEKLPHVHDLYKVDAVQPDCEKSGNIEYYECNKCSKYYADKDGSRELSWNDIVLNAIGHSYSKDWYKNGVNHWHECACGQRTDVTAHSFEWIVDQQPTEDSTGLKHEECTTCKYVRNENTVIDKLPHTHDMVMIVSNEPTCTTDGNIECYYCNKCHNYYYDYDGKLAMPENGYILPAGHKLSYQGYVAPNCVNWGYKEHYSCSICYAKFLDKEGKKQVKDEDVIIPVTPHEMMNMHDKNQHWEMCKLCFNSSNYEDHIFEWIIEKEATEEAEGSKYQQCTGCEYRTPSEEIGKLPHTHKMTKIDAKEATCDEAGNITYYSCDKCHKLFADDLGTSEITIVDTVIDPKGHDYDVTKTEKASTTKNGARHLKCKVCDAIDREDIYKVGTIAFSAPVLVYNGKKKTPGVTVTDSQGNVIDKANYSVTYPAKRTKIGKYKVTVTFKGEYTGKKTAEFVIAPKAPSSASATLYGYDDVKLSWKKSTGASGYAVYYKKATSSKYTRLTRTTKLSIKKGNLSDGIQYKFKVVPYYKSGKTYYESTAYKEVSIYTLKKLNTPVVTKSGSKVKVSWKNIAGETGYQISKATKSGKTSIAATYKTTKGTYKTLKAKKGTKYYYKVRAYKQVGKTKIYGPWSKVKSYKR